MSEMSEHFTKKLEEKMEKLNKEAQENNDAWKWRDFKNALLSGNSRGPYLEDRLEYLADAMNGVDQEVSEALLALAGKAHQEREGQSLE
jgi:hypothetical protein